MAPEEVVGLVEIAKMLGVHKRTAVRYSKLPDFPEPLARLSAGLVWRREAVETWAREHPPRRPGRPPKPPE